MLIQKGTQTIETPRLILRMAVQEDAEPMFRNWASDPEVTKFLTWPTYENVETAHSVLDQWINQYENRGYYHWMIVLKELGQPIGSISVVHMDEPTATFEIGYCIGRAWWHQGIVSETVKAVIAYLFKEVGANRITAKHDTNNPRSGRVMKRCGMQYEGTQPKAGHNNQGICDLCYYSILASDIKPQ